MDKVINDRVAVGRDGTGPASAHVMFVLVKDPSGRHAAYMGIVDLPPVSFSTHQRERSAAREWVAQHGLKLTYEQARGWFPGLEPETYR